MQIAEWCFKSWSNLTNEYIVKSFDGCGLGKTKDDSKLHSKLLQLLTDVTPDEMTGLEEMEVEDLTTENNVLYSDNESDSEVVDTLDFN